MKKIKLLKTLVGSILIVAMFLGLTGVAYGHARYQRVDTGAVIWEVVANTWHEMYLWYGITFHERWRGGHVLRSYYQNDPGRPYTIKYMRLRARLYSRNSTNQSWELNADVPYPLVGNAKYVSYLSVSTYGPEHVSGWLENTERYSLAQTMGYFQSFLGTTWSMTDSIGGKKPLVHDEHRY